MWKLFVAVSSSILTLAAVDEGWNLHGGADNDQRHSRLQQINEQAISKLGLVGAKSSARCDVVNRGVALHNDKVYAGTLDGRLIALDRRTGTPLWSVQTIDQAKAYSITSAPRIARDKVVIGNGGSEYGVRGYITAYDTATGQTVVAVPHRARRSPEGL